MWRSILSSSSRVGVDFSASCNNSLSSVERVNSSTPPSNGLRGANLSLGMKWSKGRPSLRPIPRKLIMRSCAEFYKSMLLFRATYAHLIHKSIGPLVAASKRLAKVTTTHRKLPFNSLAGCAREVGGARPSAEVPYLEQLPFPTAKRSPFRRNGPLQQQ